MTIPSAQEILIDSREQRPLVFPRHLPMLCPGSSPLRPRTRTFQISTRTIALETGDYWIEGAPVLIERKGCADELCQNLLHPVARDRVLRAFDRLALACAHPYLLLEGSPHALLAPSTRNPLAFHGVDSLQRELNARRISLLLLPTSTMDSRRAAGEWVARLLINSLATTPTDHPSPLSPVTGEQPLASEPSSSSILA